MIDRADLDRRALEYCRRAGLEIAHLLGGGVHGIVYAVRNQHAGARSAIKVHGREQYYQRERNVYHRLAREGVSSIRGFTVPEKLAQDDELFVIVMTIVTPPYVLDFAGAHLDKAPDFSEEVMRDWLAEKVEQFGADWSTVQAVLRELEGAGVFMEDVSPANICVRR